MSPCPCETAPLWVISPEMSRSLAVDVRDRYGRMAMTTLVPQRWTVSSEAGKAAGVPLALFIALAANAWHRADPNDLDVLIADRVNADSHGAVWAIANTLSYAASAGGVAVLTVAAGMYLWRRKHDVIAVATVAASVGISALLHMVTRPVIHRPGPHLADASQGSVAFVFPAGHAAGFGALATIVALLIAAKRFPVRRPGPSIAVVAAVGIVASFVRVFAGAHFFTDAAGGLALGVGVACIVAALLPFLDGTFANKRGSSGTLAAPK